MHLLTDAEAATLQGGTQVDNHIQQDDAVGMSGRIEIETSSVQFSAACTAQCDMPSGHCAVNISSEASQNSTIQARLLPHPSPFHARRLTLSDSQDVT